MNLVNYYRVQAPSLTALALNMKKNIMLQRDSKLEKSSC